ncbi:uncharacterized protein LOC135485074 [Lineus longissimus]|uniref:uncharacterized protein LOC135485074 n=1 Tax=Lineus longissimus TaxID=88925 RepID=UPI00315C569B
MGYHVIRPSYNSKSKNTRGVGCTLYEARGPETARLNEVRKLVEAMAEINPHLGICQNLDIEQDLYVSTAIGCEALVGSTIGHQLASTEGDFNVSCDTSATDSLREGFDLTCSPILPTTLGPSVNLDRYNMSEQCKKLVGNLDISLEGAHELESKTVGQSTNELWTTSRSNRLTASNFGLIFKRKAAFTDKFTRSVLTDVKDLSHVPAIRYGRENESVAIDRYKKFMTNAGFNIKVLENGLAVNPSSPWLGASPDGKILDEKSGLGQLEIKCPMSYKDIDPLDACKDDKFYCELVDGKPTLKRSHNYFYQVQGQMGICCVEWCDFVVYTKKGMLISRIKFDESFWLDVFNKLTDFYMTTCLKLLCQA